jgi:uncharacterized protein YdaU (DUF1376 family)
VTKPIFIQWCPKDALDGMQALTPLEELAYRRILDLLYVHGGKLADDDKRMAWLTKTERAWKGIKASLVDAQKIEVENGFITNKKVTAVLADTNSYIEKQRHRAQTGWDKRRKSNENRGQSNAAANATAHAGHMPHDTPRHTPDDMPRGMPQGMPDTCKPLTTNHNRDSQQPSELVTARATAEAAVRVGTEVLKRLGRDPNSVPNFGPVLSWLSNGYGEAEIIAVAERMAPRIGADIRNPLAYLAKAMPDEIEQQRTRENAVRPGADERLQWLTRYRNFIGSNLWLGTWGPKPPKPDGTPGEPNHWVPQDIIDEVALDVPGFLKRA